MSRHTTGSTALNGIPIPLIAYADDITLLGDTTAQCLTRFQHQLDICNDFALQYGLRFNTSKCVSTAAGDRLLRLAPLTIHDEPIPTSDSAIILGCSFTGARFDPDAHLSRMITKTLRATNLLSFSGMFFSDLTLHRKASLAKVFGRSHLEYGLQLIPANAERMKALNSTLTALAAATLVVSRGSYTQLCALGLDCYEHRLPSLTIQRLRRLRSSRTQAPAIIIRLLADRCIRTSLTSTILTPLNQRRLTTLFALDTDFARAGTRQAKKLAAQAINNQLNELMSQTWNRIARNRRTVRELTNDPRSTHWSLRLAHPRTNHLWSRYLCGIWVPGHPPCTSCPVSPDGRPWPLTRQHLMHCTHADELLSPLINNLLATPLHPLLQPQHTRPTSNPTLPFPPDAPLLSRLAALPPTRLQWTATRTHTLCEPSLRLIDQLHQVLLVMKERIDTHCPRN